MERLRCSLCGELAHTHTHFKFLQELWRDAFMPSPIMQYFAYQHLPENVQGISSQVWMLANSMESHLPDGPEKSAGLRKLLEAKDCFVRAALS
jgi:hypothetical protein